MKMSLRTGEHSASGQSAASEINVLPVADFDHQPQNFAPRQLQRTANFAPGCTYLHLVAQKLAKTKIFLPTATTATLKTPLAALANLRLAPTLNHFPGTLFFQGYSRLFIQGYSR